MILDMRVRKFEKAVTKESIARISLYSDRRGSSRTRSVVMRHVGICGILHSRALGARVMYINQREL